MNTHELQVASRYLAYELQKLRETSSQLMWKPGNAVEKLSRDITLEAFLIHLHILFRFFYAPLPPRQPNEVCMNDYFVPISDGENWRKDNLDKKGPILVVPGHIAAEYLTYLSTRRRDLSKFGKIYSAVHDLMRSFAESVPRDNLHPDLVAEIKI